MADSKTPATHAAVRKVLEHHNLGRIGDGVVEADLIYAVLDSVEDKPADELARLRGECSQWTREISALVDANESLRAEVERLERELIPPQPASLIISRARDKIAALTAEVERLTALNKQLEKELSNHAHRT